MRTVVLDKTGTVTEGAPSVTDVLAAPGVGKERLLELAVSVEGRSEHPLARAVCAYARERKVYPLLVEDFRQIPGEGVAALVDDHPSLAGNLRMMEARGIETGTFAEAADELVVSLNTVKSHVRRIYAKMGVNGKADLLEKVSSAI